MEYELLTGRRTGDRSRCCANVPGTDGLAHGEDTGFFGPRRRTGEPVRDGGVGELISKSLWQHHRPPVATAPGLVEVTREQATAGPHVAQWPLGRWAELSSVRRRVPSLLARSGGPWSPCRKQRPACQDLKADSRILEE